MIQITIEYRWKGRTVATSFGARPCRALRVRLMKDGVASLPRSWRRKWIVQRILATPPWTDFNEIRKIYDYAQQRTIETGIEWNVDHQIPLLHPRVCGLHVPWNLVPMPAKVNNAKSNKWNPDQLELF